MPKKRTAPVWLGKQVGNVQIDAYYDEEQEAKAPSKRRYWAHCLLCGKRMSPWANNIKRANERSKNETPYSCGCQNKGREKLGRFRAPAPKTF